MDQKPLGRTGRTISAVGLGCVTFGREIDEDASYRVLDYALEKGITLLDTAAASFWRKLTVRAATLRSAFGWALSTAPAISSLTRVANTLPPPDAQAPKTSTTCSTVLPSA